MITTPILYLVSSNVAYEQPRKLLLESLKPFISTEDTLVVVGGCPSYLIGDGFRNVTHNSFDYTALIEWVSRPTSHQHVLLLHDTMQCTSRTDDLVRQADRFADVTAAYPGGQCNLALYRASYLIEMKDKILALMNCTKAQAVDAEGFLVKSRPSAEFYPNPTVDVVAEGPFYGGLTRRTELYCALQVYKHKASWGQKMETIEQRVVP